MVKKSKSIVKPSRSGNSGELAIPEHLKGEGRGFEGVGKGDILLPRIKLLQPLSPEVTEEGMEAGTLVNSLSKKNYGEELIFIPILHTKSRILWIPRDEGGGMECSSLTGIKPVNPYIIKENKKEVPYTSCDTCPRSQWNGDEPPACTIYFNFLITVVSENEPVILSFSKTKTKIGKKLISLTRYVGGNLDMFAKKYKLSAVMEKNSQKQSYYNYGVMPLEFCSPKEYKMAENFYLSLKDKPIQSQMEGEE